MKRTVNVRLGKCHAECQRKRIHLKQKAVAWYRQKTNLAYFAFPRNKFVYKLTIDNINFYDDTDDGDDS